MYDATLWIAGPRWSAAEPHALDLEPSRAVSSENLVKTAIGEMRDLKVGDERQLKVWQAEMSKVIPSVRAGDQVVILCTDANRTLVYLNDASNGEVDDPSILPGGDERMASSADQTSGGAEITAPRVKLK